VSLEMIEDAGVDLLGYMGTNVGQALGLAVNAGLTTGTGTTQPTGIVTSAGSGITGGTGVSGAFTTNNVIDLVYSTDNAVRRLPGFGIMGGATAMAAARKLQDGNGSYVWQPSLQAGQPDRLLGYAVFENPSMAAVATSAKSLIAGDLKSYIVRQVGGIRLDRSDDYAFADGLVTFRAIFRVDGGLPQAAHVKTFAGGAS
jgi:HK97 family phage major capsid protein